jgi:ferredoxin
MGAAGDGSGAVRLRIDPTACAGVGVCAPIAGVTLDRWGYPIVPVRALTADELPAAARAVRGCPRRALWLEGGAARP